MQNLDSLLNQKAPAPFRSDYRIGVIGAGFIVRDVQLVAYQNAGYQVAAIASRTPETARAVAELRGIPKVYDHYEELLADPEIQILDIAFPPADQLAIIRKAVQQSDHIKGILAQKPLAPNYQEAVQIVELCEKSGIKLVVNQNMRYDPAVRTVKSLLEGGFLGEPVFATVDMRAVPHWQAWLHGYDRLTLLNMSVHHLDFFRFLLGTPASVYCSTRTDPRTRFAHRDGICAYILEYENGLRASAWDDVWVGPGANNADVDAYIKWRVEGTEGVAEGFIGWPGYPNRSPSTIEFTTGKHPQFRFAPRDKRVWFPDAFAGTMSELMQAVSSGVEVDLNGRNNLDTMSLVDACYLSIEEHRPVRIAEIRAKAAVTSSTD